MSSTYPSQRRRDPQPLNRGGEVALVALAAALLAVSLAALAGLGCAALITGGGWVWPHGTTAATRVLGGLLTGRPGRGLPPRQGARVPGPVLTYGCVVVCELALLVVSILGGVLYLRWHRPGDARGGMATRAEAEAVLGVSRLRGARAIIRPDLYRTSDEASSARRPSGAESGTEISSAPMGRP